MFSFGGCFLGGERETEREHELGWVGKWAGYRSWGRRKNMI